MLLNDLFFHQSYSLRATVSALCSYVFINVVKQKIWEQKESNYITDKKSLLCDAKPPPPPPHLNLPNPSSQIHISKEVNQPLKKVFGIILF